MCKQASIGRPGLVLIHIMYVVMSMQIFFAKVPPTALASEVENLFGSFGKLAEVNLFRAWAGARHSKVKHRM